MKNLFLISVIIILAVSLVFGGCPETAPPEETPTTAPPGETPTTAPIKLLLATPDPETSAWAPVLKGWASELEERAGGRVTVEFAWGGTLGPNMEEYYDFAKSGVCDIGWVSTGLSPGLFTMTQIPTLPWIFPSASIASKALYELYKAGYLDNDFTDVKVCYLCSSADMGDVIFTNDKPIRTLADVNGLKLFGAAELITARISAMGGTPANVAVPELSGAVEKGVVDGFVCPWNISATLGWFDVANYCIEPGMGAAITTVCMNKNTWDNLPADIQAIIDDISEKYTLEQGSVSDNLLAQSKQAFVDNGGEINEWSEEDLSAMDQLFPPLWENFIADREVKGLPVKDAINLFYNTLKEEGVEKPAIGYTPGG